MPSLIAMGTIFGLIALTHLGRTIAEWPRLVSGIARGRSSLATLRAGADR